MNCLKKNFAVIMILLTFNLYIPSIAPAGESFLYAKVETTKHTPEGRIILEKKIPKQDEESWISKYKWWLIAGVVVIAGAAAAGGGGGGGGTETTAEQPDDQGNYTVTW